MVQYACDTLIKILREERKLTQSQLAEGICTRDTISRIERGERLPDWFTFSSIMAKVGEDPQKYYKSIATKEEKRAWELRQKLTYNTVTKNYDKNKTLIEKLEKDEAFKKGVNRQHLLKEKGVNLIGLNIRKKTGEEFKEAYNYLIEAIKITRPDFDECKIDTYFLTPDEILIINSIAIANDKIYGIERATETFLQLKRNIDRNYINEDEKMKHATVLWSNIARNMRYLKRYEECIAICDEGITFCKKQFESYFYPKFLMNKCHTLFLMGKYDEAVELFKQTCYLYRGLERFDDLKSFKKMMNDEFGVEIDI